MLSDTQAHYLTMHSSFQFYVWELDLVLRFNKTMKNRTLLLYMTFQ
jgi:hypothetical protein